MLILCLVAGITIIIKQIMTIPSGDTDTAVFDYPDSRGYEKIICHLRLHDRPFFQTSLNPSGQTVSPVTLVISHYL